VLANGAKPILNKIDESVVACHGNIAGWLKGIYCSIQPADRVNRISMKGLDGSLMNLW
jgi:hypothetical protein